MSPPYLTPAEEHILVLLACGCSKQEIAAHLGRSIHTVKSHLRRAAQRLDARSTTHLVALALAHFLLPTDTALRGGLGV